MKSITRTLWFCLLPLGALAQDQRLTTVTPVLAFSAGRESQTIVGQGNLEDTVYLVSPSLFGLRKFTPRTQISLYYQPEFEFFGSHRELNSWNHSARFYLEKKITPRLSYDLGDSFLTTRDPSRQLGNSFLLLPRTRYRENSFYANFTYSLDPATQWSFRFDHTVTLFGLPSEFRRGYLDQMGYAWSTSLAHRFTPNRRLTVRYAFLRLNVLDAQNLPLDLASGGSNTHFLTAGYSHTFNPDFMFTVTTGIIRATDLSYTLSGVVERRLGPLWLDAGYSRSIAFYGSPALQAAPALDPRFANGLLASNLYQMGSAGIRARPSRRLELELRATGARNSARLTEFDSHSFLGHGRLAYRLSQRLVLFTTAEIYTQTLNELPGIPSRRTRFFGGLEVGLFPSSRPTQTLQAPGIPGGQAQATGPTEGH